MMGFLNLLSGYVVSFKYPTLRIGKPAFDAVCLFTINPSRSINLNPSHCCVNKHHIGDGYRHVGRTRAAESKEDQ